MARAEQVYGGHLIDHLEGRTLQQHYGVRDAASLGGVDHGSPNHYLLLLLCRWTAALERAGAKEIEAAELQLVAFLRSLLDRNWQGRARASEFLSASHGPHWRFGYGAGTLIAAEFSRSAVLGLFQRIWHCQVSLDVLCSDPSGRIIAPGARSHVRTKGPEGGEHEIVNTVHRTLLHLPISGKEAGDGWVLKDLMSRSVWVARLCLNLRQWESLLPLIGLRGRPSFDELRFPSPKAMPELRVIRWETGHLAYCPLLPVAGQICTGPQWAAAVCYASGAVQFLADADEGKGGPCPATLPELLHAARELGIQVDADPLAVVRLGGGREPEISAGTTLSEVPWAAAALAV